MMYASFVWWRLETALRGNYVKDKFKRVKLACPHIYRYVDAACPSSLAAGPSCVGRCSIWFLLYSMTCPHRYRRQTRPCGCGESRFHVHRPASVQGRCRMWFRILISEFWHICHHEMTIPHAEYSITNDNWGESDSKRQVQLVGSSAPISTPTVFSCSGCMRPLGWIFIMSQLFQNPRN